MVAVQNGKLSTDYLSLGYTILVFISFFILWRSLFGQQSKTAWIDILVLYSKRGVKSIYGELMVTKFENSLSNHQKNRSLQRPLKPWRKWSPPALTYTPESCDKLLINSI